MSRPLPSWQRLADAAGVRRCRGIRSDGAYCREYDHLSGGWEPGVVHWADRSARWPSVARFVKLAAYASRPELGDDPVTWRRLYLVNMEMRVISRRAGIRIPARCLRSDRLTVRMHLVDVPGNTDHRQQAFDWSRRGLAFEPLNELELRALWGDR